MNWSGTFQLLIGVVVGGLLTGGIQWILSRQAYARDEKRDAVAYARQMATDERNRLISRYERLIVASQSFSRNTIDLFSIGKALQISQPIAEPLGLTTGMYNSKFSPAYLQAKEAEQEFETASALLRLEGEHPDVLRPSIAMRKIFNEYILTYDDSDPEAPAFPWGEFTGKLNELTNALESRMRKITDIPTAATP